MALVHHANQYIITNGYQNREGIEELVGGLGSRNGYRKILELHKAYRIPLNLHLSGTLLEALIWHHPDFLEALQEFAQVGLLELIGSSYGQNIMRFFSHEHNLQQIQEELQLYSDHLPVDPHQIKVFWPPERVWDTERMARVLRDPRLLNQGYHYVLVDDRLLLAAHGNPSPRHRYDREQPWDPQLFQSYFIQQGQGLVALPIANNLRQSLPPRGEHHWHNVQAQLHWLSTLDPSAYGGDVIAIYGDDMEKAAGVGGWDGAGALQFEAFLGWVRDQDWIAPVKLSEWAAACRVAGARTIDVGTFVELANHFEAGEDYEKWYFDTRWHPYRAYFSWSESRVHTLTALGADPTLMALAEKHLLASSWETAWHTPSTGAHGDPQAHGDPSPWIKALASHSRHAAVIAEAAFWMRHRDHAAHAYTADLDNDGEEELILKNDKLFAVFAPRWGGRLLYLFNLDGEQGNMVIGNSCDDWNLMEELNKYVEVPANHPGALTDLGYEHDVHSVLIEVAHGSEVRAKLINGQHGSAAVGMEKAVRLAYESNEMQVTYQLPHQLPALRVECGLSPDYLHLLRSGRRFLKELSHLTAWGYAANGVTVWLRLEDTGLTVFDQASQREFGHGQAIQLKASSRRFTIWIGSGQPGEPIG